MNIEQIKPIKKETILNSMLSYKEEETYIIYKLKNYNVSEKEDKKGWNCDHYEGNLKEIENELQNDKGYHIRLKNDDNVMFFGDLDGYQNDINVFKNELKEYLKIFDLNFDDDDFVFTENMGYEKDGKSFHYTVKNLYGNIKKIRMIIEGFKKKHKYGKIIDCSIYSDKWWRLPNQRKKGKYNTEHKIIKGEIKDFIVTYIQKESYNVDDVNLDKETEIEVFEKKKKTSKKKKDENQKEIELDNLSELSMTTYNESTNTKMLYKVNIIDEKKKKEDIIRLFINRCYKVERADDYNSWINFGMALKNYFSEEVGYELFDLFSKKSPKYNKDEVLLKWYDIKPRLEDEKEIITIGSIYYWAEQDHPEEYSLILNDEKWFDNILLNITHNDLARYIKFNMKCNNFIWVENELFCFDGKRWQKNFNEFSRYISEDLYNHILNKVISMKQYEEILDKIVKQLKMLKHHSFKRDIIEESKIYFTNDNIRFNNNPFLLGFENGVLDLRSLEFRKYKFDDYITMSCRYDYIKETDIEKIDFMNHLLKTIMSDDLERKLYLQILSSGLDGQVLEKIVIFNGGGRNGKGMINEFMVYLLGDYVYGQAPNVLISKPLPTGPCPEVFKMNYKRLIIFKEPPEDTPIDNSIIKEITGGGSISGRNCNSNNSTVVMNNTTIIECNKKPKYKEEPQRADIERTIDLRFKNTFTTNEEDVNNVDIFLGNSHYKSYEFKEQYRYAFLHILLEAYQELRRNNYMLKIPESIKKNNEEYLEQSIKLMEFLNERYVKTDKEEDFIKIDDIKDEFTLSDFYENLTKIEKRKYNKKYFTDFFSNYKPLRLHYRERKKIDGVDYRNILIKIKKIE
jgi:phage/plasmid-associated DNA primase